MSSETLPDKLFDTDGNEYTVTKPHEPDHDNWVRLYPTEKAKPKSKKPKLPKPYTDVLAKVEGRFQVLRHEAGWWYGKPKGWQPDSWVYMDVVATLFEGNDTLIIPREPSVLVVGVGASTLAKSRALSFIDAATACYKDMVETAAEELQNG